MILQPGIALVLWHAGTEEAGKAKFKSIYDVGPVFEQPGMLPYTELNSDIDHLAYKGGYKPTWSVGLKRLSPSAMEGLWKLYLEFLNQNPESKLSAAMIECYGYGKTREIPAEETAFPHRDINFHA
jgi:hypothetical protein